MTEILIYINDELCDVSPGTVVAKNIKAANVFNFEISFFDYTNNFTLPYSTNNDRIFGIAKDSSSNSSVPYTVANCRILQGGIEVIKDGLAFLEESDNGYKINVFDGLIKFKNNIGSKNITETDLSDYYFEWDPTNISSNRNNTTGLVPAVYNNGVFFADPGALLPLTLDGDSYYNKWCPAFYCKTLIEEIFLQNGGFEVDFGALATDDRFTKLALPTRITYDDKFSSGFDFKAEALPQSNILNGANVKFERIITPNDAWLTNDNYDLSVFDLGTGSSDCVVINFYVELNVTVTGASVTLGIVSGDNVSETIPIGANQVVRLGRTVDFDTAHQNSQYSSNAVISVTRSGGGVGVLNINGGYIVAKMPTNTQVPIVTATPSPPRINLVDRMLPHISITNFLKDIKLFFGCVYYVSGQTAYVRTLKQIFADKANAIDLTNKRDTTRLDKIIYNYSTLAQTVNMKFSKSEELGILGDGSFEVDNTKLDPVKDYTTSLGLVDSVRIDPDNLILRSRVTFADLKHYDIDTDAFTDIGDHIIFIRDTVPATDPLLLIDGVEEQDYKIGYTFPGGFSTSSEMNFQEFLDTYYADVIEVLQKPKLLERYYYLNDVDINTISPIRLIKDGNEYFFLQQVFNHVPGKVTRMQLLKIF